MGPPINAFPMTPMAPAITISAAGDAARDLKRGRNTSGRAFATSRGNEERLKRRSNKMARDLQGAMEKSVRRKLNSMSGSQNNRKVGLKVAQFIPGKGLEVPGAQLENESTIYCSLGEKGDKTHDALDKTFSTISGKQISQDFAFKLVNNDDTMLEQDKKTRVTAFNVFRHLNPKSFCYYYTGWNAEVHVSNQAVASFNITNRGSFTEPSAISVSFTGSPDTIATAYGTWRQLGGSNLYELDEVIVTNPGAGYTTTPIASLTVQGATITTNPYATVVMGTTNDSHKSEANWNWHSTLGPDAAPIRRGTGGSTQFDVEDAGTWRGIDNSKGPTGYGTLAKNYDDPANTLLSPYRYPKDMEFMYSRINRQVLENYGWMLNPYKFKSFQSQAPAGQDAYNPIDNNLQVWSNPSPESMEFSSDVNDLAWKRWSFPSWVNTHAVGDLEQGDNSYSFAGYEYRSQLGSASLDYAFSNDGTNPVCIDVCIIGVKKDKLSNLDQFKSIAGVNYKINKFLNQGDTNLNGFQTRQVIDGGADIDIDQAIGSTEWHSNAKLPFVPDVCFKNPASAIQAMAQPATGGSAVAVVAQWLQEGTGNPFKVVKRDQFIVGAGNTRQWKTTLPSANYKPDVHDSTQSTWQWNAQNAAPFMNNVIPTHDEYTYTIAIGAHGLAKPVEETLPVEKVIAHTTPPTKGTVDVKTIIDRQPTTCNVSVVGTYKETVKPCYPVDTSSINFINGRLTEPFFTTEPGFYSAPANIMPSKRVNTVDIASIQQVVRVADDGVVGVGAITTDIGA